MRYKFRYFNSFYKTCSVFGCALQNFFVTIAFFLLIYYLLGRLTILIGVEDYFINETVKGFVIRTMLVCAFASVVVYYFFRKGVFLHDDRLVIARYTITPINWKPRITVRYDEIENVNINYTDLHFTKYRYSLLMPGADESYNVELTLKNGKKYFFSIYDQEEFCDNLNVLIENTK